MSITINSLKDAAERSNSIEQFQTWIDELVNVDQQKAFRILESVHLTPETYWTKLTKTNTILNNTKRTNSVLGKLITEDQTRLARSIKKLEERITDRSADLLTDRGRLVSTKANMKVLQKMHTDLTFMFDDMYGAGVRESIAGFDGIIRNIRRSFTDLDLVMDFTAIDKNMIEALKATTFENFSAYGDAAQKRLMDGMYSQVLTGAKMSTLANTIKGIFTGHTDIRGRPMSMYANQYAFDSVMNFHNTVNNKKAEDIGLTHFLYMGDIITTSRPFCIRRAGRTYTKEMIESWNGMPWAGKSGPAFTNRGGYNCRHHWVGVKPEWVPEEGVDVQTYEGFEGQRATQRLLPRAKSIGVPSVKGKAIPVSKSTGTPSKAIINKTPKEVYNDAKVSYKAKQITKEQLFSAEMKYVGSLDEVAYLKERDILLKKMTRPVYDSADNIAKVKNNMDKVRKGTSWIPYDVLRSLQDKRYRIQFVDAGPTHRAYFKGSASPEMANLRRSAIVDFMDSSTTIAHEISHAIDHMWSNRKWTGGMWKDTLFTTVEDGKNYRGWYKKQHSSQKGIYKNGDGEFWKDNWITDYEGRIYSGRPKSSVGTEWWSMNCQRFKEYKETIPNYDDVLKWRRDELIEETKLFKAGRISKNDFNIATRRVQEVEQLTPEQWASKATEWGQAKEKYPELTDFIERKFDTRFTNTY